MSIIDVYPFNHSVASFFYMPLKKKMIEMKLDLFFIKISIY